MKTKEELIQKIIDDINEQMPVGEMTPEDVKQEIQNTYYEILNNNLTNNSEFHRGYNEGFNAKSDIESDR